MAMSRNPVALTLKEIAALVHSPLPVPDTQVKGITMNAQAVQPGDIFVALQGSQRHGIEFAQVAQNQGAVAIWTDPAAAQGGASPLPIISSENIRESLGAVSSAIYGNPTNRLKIFGITGTQGKTTTSFLAQAAASRESESAAVIGTMGTFIGDRALASALTTPEAPELQALFASMLHNRVDFCAMEVSSHALVQGRVNGVQFDVSAFINLGRDHLDFHRDMDDYFAAKARLFDPQLSKYGVINIDDPYGAELARSVSIDVDTVSLLDTDADWRVRNIQPQPRGSHFQVDGPDGVSTQMFVPLLGEFNVLNSVIALAAIVRLGYDPEQAIAGIAAMSGVPGRMQRVHSKSDALVIVDYAHKPDAVEAVLTALRPVTKNRLMIVLGAGGDRDSGKRPMMGECAARLADVVIVTDDNPRFEDPVAIRHAVLAGAHHTDATVVEIADRKSAIEHALALSAEGDTVVIAGKGHETGQEIGGEIFDFDDAAVVRAWQGAQA